MKRIARHDEHSLVVLFDERRLAADDATPSRPFEGILDRCTRFDLAERRPRRRRQNDIVRRRLCDRAAGRHPRTLRRLPLIVSRRLVWRDACDEEPCVESPRVRRRRHPVREMNERIQRETQPLAQQDITQCERSVMHVASILLEPRAIVGAGERDELAARVARQQHTSLFEELARGSDVICHRFGLGHAGKLTARVRGAVTPGIIHERGIAIRGVHSPPRKHMRATHERSPLVPPDHEDFWPRCAVAENQDGRGGVDGKVAGHGGTILVDDRWTRRSDPTMDMNGKIAALLRDFAAIQKSKQSMWGYRRAAAAILALEEPIESLLEPDGTLKKIPNIGPSSSRVILEVLTTGTSPTVEAAIAGSGQKSDIERRRDLRGNFLSRAQVLAALRNKRLHGPTLADYRGDLQMHSTWSDGTQTLDAIVEAGLDRGYHFCAVTDHSYGLPIAHGVSMHRLFEQHRIIDALNEQYTGRFKLIKGIEANIRADGSVDMEPQELRQLELVVAAPHAALRTTADQTKRMIAAVKTPGVHILGHPRGRKYGSRPGVTADWDRVFAAAVKSGVAVEIDGDPSRQDLDFEIARRAIDVGCLFALDSDAHSTGELRYAETAIAHARLAGVPKERVINCWETERLLEWLRSRTSS